MDFDLAVVGSGLVGTSFVRAARGLSVALIGATPRSAASLVGPSGFDVRVYAISPGSAAFLSELKVWQALPVERLTPVHAMRVYGDEGSSLIEFDAYRSGIPELAWIAEDRVLHEALWRALEARDDVQYLGPAECEGLEVSQPHASLTLRDGRTLRARLVVGADGAHSFVRQAAGIAAPEVPYGQTAVVANFACERPHRNVAYQWFRKGPVLALLPLPGDHVSMVWSTDDEEAQRLLALDSEALGREVGAASRDALGSLTPVTPARGYPLRRLSAQRLVLPRVALIGDAAHVVHPLAGQGANLGFQDARELASVLAQREPERDPGDFRLLRRYERARAEPVLAMRAAVHGLYRLFGSESGLLIRGRNAGLNLTNRIPVVKTMLARHAIG
jgi:2-octaprenylphenol hydroxylase